MGKEVVWTSGAAVTGYLYGGEKEPLPRLSPRTETNLLFLIGMDVKPKTIKLLEENTDYLFNFGIGKYFSESKRHYIQDYKINTFDNRN